MLSDRGGIPDFVKVLDFGLVREMDAAGMSESQTKILEGTPAFLAPEAIKDPGSIDHRVDIYALGCVAYWMLTGRMVFEAAGVIEMCSQHLYAEPRPPSEFAPEIPRDLEQVVLACLRKAPDQRPVDTEQLDALLGECSAADEWSREAAREYWRRRREKARPAEQALRGRLAIDIGRRPARFLDV
jgi:serine/threonine-protein kinase